MTHKKHRRVRWKVRRCADGWLPVVLIGEEPMTLRCEPDKATAKAVARRQAGQLNSAQALT
jgi:hypothetical protein